MKAFSLGGKSHCKLFVDVIPSLMTCNLCRELSHLTKRYAIIRISRDGELGIDWFHYEVSNLEKNKLGGG